MYNKEDAGKALINLKEGNKRLQKYKNYDENLKRTKASYSKLGFVIAGLLGLCILLGISKIALIIIFASLSSLTLVGTIGIRAYFNKEIQKNKDEWDKLKKETEMLTFIHKKKLSPMVNVMQNVMSEDAKITKVHEKIIKEWKDHSAYKDTKVNPDKDDDIKIL